MAQLDPDIADAFVAMEQRIKTIAERYRDTEEDLQRKIKFMAFAIAEEP